MSGQPTGSATTASLSHVGRVRTINQDDCAEFVKPDGMQLLVVADGMGGHLGGEVASRTAVEAIGESIQNGSGAPAEMLERAFNAANRRVFDLAAEEAELHGMGTTGVAILLDPSGAAWVAHVGDSRAYRLRGGRLERITDDHSWVFNEMQNMRLTPEEAKVHPHRNALMRAIGVDPEVDVDVTQIDLAAGDRLLLCSDGLWNEVDEETMATVLAEQEPKDCVQRLVHLANEAGGNDNVTVQVALLPSTFTASAPPPAAGPSIAMWPPSAQHRTRLGIAAALLAASALVWLALSLCR
jgi:serine/threonine protein phosphatase PrpC